MTRAYHVLSIATLIITAAPAGVLAQSATTAASGAVPAPIAPVPDTTNQRAEAAQALTAAQASLDAAIHTPDAPAELVRWATTALNVARTAFRAGHYDLVLDSAAVVTSRAERAIHGPKSDVFDRRSAAAGEPSLKDSLPYGVTPVGPGVPAPRESLPFGATRPAPGAAMLPDSLPASAVAAEPTPAVHP
jgi:hypothetical protein